MERKCEVCGLKKDEDGWCEYCAKLYNSFGRNTRVFFLHFMEENTQTIFLTIIKYGIYWDLGVDDEGVAHLVKHGAQPITS